MHGRLIAFALGLACLCSACEAPERGNPGVTAFSIMTFNVENLFDAADDPGKDDHDYLPLELKQTEAHRSHCEGLRFASWRERCLSLDWNEGVVTRKLQAIAGAILQLDDGKGADIVMLQEVENIGILERLRNEYLAAAGYGPAILIEGDDSRGIDLAFLSRLPLAGAPRLHDVEFDASFADAVADTRGILQADFSLPDGTLLTGFAVHFPAPYHPTPMRVAAYESLNRLAGSLPAGRVAFAAGDFNTTSAEDAAEHLLDRFVRPGWTVSNDLCDGCPGTSYYPPDDSWSFLDMILLRHCCSENTTSVPRAISVQLANAAPGQATPAATPARFDPDEASGVSDHWPVVMRVEIANKQ